MLRVKNVKVSDGRLYADYCYEDKTDIGHVVLDAKTGKLLEKRMNAEDTKYDGLYTFPKVIYFLREMIEHNDFPSESICMWY
jgi:hypothetical protein